MSTPNILLDCDGVLADFVTGTICAHGIRDFDHDDVDCWAYYEKWGLTAAQFWDKCSGREFWETLPPYPWAVELYRKLSEIGEVTIVTSPPRDPEACTGKMNWLRAVLGIDPGQVFVGSRKSLMARYDNILIDDHTGNTDPFEAHGGAVFLFPQPWNGYANGTWQRVVERTRGYAEFVNLAKKAG